MNDVDRLVAHLAPDPGPPGVTPLARELMEEITAIPVAPPEAPRRGRPPVPRRRVWLAVPLLAALAVALTWVFPTAIGIRPAAAALDIKREGDDYVITVKDLLAEPEVYQSELRARGLDITLRLVPTSPSMVGNLFVINDVDLLRAAREVPAEGPIKPISGPGPCESPLGCPIGVRVPLDFRKKAEITLGRQARPGERYLMPPNLDHAGEPLHCVEFINKTVAEISALLRERGVEPALASHGGRDGAIPDTWYVHDGVMSAPGKALLLTGQEPDPHPRPMPGPCPAARD